MIRLNRRAEPIPETLSTKGRDATAKLKREATKGKKEFKFSQAIYGAADVRKALRDMQNGKCAFCESSLPQSTAGHVEHFRPKGEVQQAGKSPVLRPGYYWLAYDWDNLLLACEWCNTRAKGRFFPLEDDSKRGRSHRDDLSKESPLLLDPANDDPANHLEFKEEVVRPKKRSRKGTQSIETYRLNDAELAEHRRDKLQLFRTLLKLRDLARDSRFQPEFEESSAQVREWEGRIQRGDIAYTAMLRENLTISK